MEIQHVLYIPLRGPDLFISKANGQYYYRSKWLIPLNSGSWHLQKAKMEIDTKSDFFLLNGPPVCCHENLFLHPPRIISLNKPRDYTTISLNHRNSIPKEVCPSSSFQFLKNQFGQPIIRVTRLFQVQVDSRVCLCSLRKVKTQSNLLLQIWLGLEAYLRFWLASMTPIDPPCQTQESVY